MTDVLVLGAGPAGLVAALDAATAGHRCTVLEAGSQVGGMAGSFEIAGQRVDHGSHRLHPATPPALLDLLGRLLGEDLQVRQRRGRLHIGGRWVGFPLRAANLFTALPPMLTARLTVDTARAGVDGGLRALRRGAGATPAEPATFEQAIIDRFGPTVARELYGPYATKLYGLDPAALHAELADRRVSAAGPVDIVRRLVTAGRPTGRTFLYPRRGYGQIVERLAEAAVDAGASVRLGSAITGVQVDDDGVTVSAGPGGDEHRGAVCLSTIPLAALAGMVDPAPPETVTEALAKVRTRAMILVYLVLDRPRYTPFDAHYLPGPDTAVARLSEPKNYRDGDDPDDRTVLCAEIPCWPSDDRWTWPADRLAELVTTDLGRVGLPAVRPSQIEIRRLPSVYPVYDLAGVGARATIDRWIRSSDRLLTLGRQGLRVIDNLHHVMDMGREAVAAIDPDGVVDLEAWHRSLDRFGANTVED